MAFMVFLSNCCDMQFVHSPASLLITKTCTVLVQLMYLKGIYNVKKYYPY